MRRNFVWAVSMVAGLALFGAGCGDELSDDPVPGQSEVDVGSTAAALVAAPPRPPGFALPPKPSPAQALVAALIAPIAPVLLAPPPIETGSEKGKGVQPDPMPIAPSEFCNSNPGEPSSSPDECVAAPSDP